MKFLFPTRNRAITHPVHLVRWEHSAVHGAGIAPPPPREANKVNAELLQPHCETRRCEQCWVTPVSKKEQQQTGQVYSWLGILKAGSVQEPHRQAGTRGPQGQQAGQRRVQGTERAVPLEVTGNTATPAAPRSPAGCCWCCTKQLLSSAVARTTPAGRLLHVCDWTGLLGHVSELQHLQEASDSRARRAAAHHREQYHHCAPGRIWYKPVLEMIPIVRCKCLKKPLAGRWDWSLNTYCTSSEAAVMGDEIRRPPFPHHALSHTAAQGDNGEVRQQQSHWGMGAADKPSSCKRWFMAVCWGWN